MGKPDIRSSNSCGYLKVAGGLVALGFSLLLPTAWWRASASVNTNSLNQPRVGETVGSPTPLSTASSTAGNSTPAATGSVSAWQLSPLTPLGNLTGEGQWLAFLQTADGQTVAYRTFLRTDPKLPNALSTIVAFNLKITRLHFVLGTIEPLPLTAQPSRTGMIPLADRQPGILLATFNGGFKARPDYYGAMADGLVALPAIQGLATVAIYHDGRVQIGQWGTDIQDSPDLVAWRQNGQMLIHNGEINPATKYTTVTWGLTLKGEAITWRSALGLSADGQTLYYVAGPQLDVPMLTKVMVQLGAANALQLDVNGFWVHFAAIRYAMSSLVAEPLVATMSLEIDRYLKASERDFFYVTAVTQR